MSTATKTKGKAHILEVAVPDAIARWNARIAPQQARDAEHWASIKDLEAADAHEECDAEIASLKSEIKDLEAADEAIRETTSECRDRLTTLQFDELACLFGAVGEISDWFKALPDDVVLPGIDSSWFVNLASDANKVDEILDDVANMLFSPSDPVVRQRNTFHNLCAGPGDVDGVTRCVIEADDHRVLAGKRRP